MRVRGVARELESKETAEAIGRDINIQDAFPDYRNEIALIADEVEPAGG